MNGQLPGHPRPLAIQLVTCDWITTEAGTNKKTLIGVFDNFMVAQFPVTHPIMCVYAKVTDAQGRYVFRLELEDLEANNVIGRTVTPEVEAVDRLGTYELAFRLQNVRFDHPGRYEFRLYANDLLVGHTSIRVVQVQPQEGGGQQ